MKKYEFNVETGEIVEKDLTKSEITQIEKDRAEFLAGSQKEQQITEARNKALAKLAALGLTEDEIAAL